MTLATKIADAFAAVGQDVKTALRRDTATHGAYYGSSANKNVDTLAAGDDGLFSTSNPGTFPPDATVSFWHIRTQRTYLGDLSAAVQTAESYAPTGTGKPKQWKRNRANDGTLSSWYRVVIDGDGLNVTDGDLDVNTGKTPALLRKRYVNANDYVPSSDLADCHAGITAAITDAGQGRELVFSQGRRFALTSRANGGFILPYQSRVIMEPGTLIDASAWDVTGTPTAKTLFQASGQYDYFSTATVGYDATLKRHFITVSDASLWKLGDVGFVYSTNVFTSKEAGNAGRNAEYFVVAAKDDAQNRLYLTGGLQGTYTTGVGCRRQVLKGQLTFENPQLLGPSAFANNAQGDMGVAAYYLDEARIIGGSIKNFDKGAVWLYAPRRFKVDGVEASIAPFQTDSPTRYAIAVADTTESGIIENCVVRGGRESISLTNSGSNGLMGGPSRDVTIRGNDVSGAQRSGINTHDNHQNLVIDGNFLHDCESFINLRIRDVRLTNNRGSKSGGYLASLDCAVHVENGGGDFVAHGNHWDDVARGWWISGNTVHEEAPGNWNVSDDVITGNRTHHGLFLDFDGGTAVPDNALLGTINFDNVDWTLNGLNANMRGVYGRGRWDRFRFRGRVRGGNTSTPKNVVWLREPDSGTGGNGPARVDIEVEYDTTGFLPVLIGDSTGRVRIREVGIDGLANNELGKTVLANEFWNIGSLAPQGTSFFDVAVPEAAVGDWVQVSSADTTLGGIWIWAEIITAGSVRLRAFNTSAGTINPVGAQFYINLTKRS
tara:strand:+ start:28440 stop:30761 length:2322 start_codon:yes stop_codon:yes gene_type:complete